MALTLSKIKSKLNGRELDLSVLELKEIPVKELTAIPKATHLDLSVNYITTIPDNFSSLSHLVKLDLSKNRIKELPDNFGDLQNLKRLDLFSNSLTLLPESFYSLTNLKWLDLKNNPLNAQLKAVAGECITWDDCHNCAKRVVKFMKDIHEDLEKEREKTALKQQAKAALRQKRAEAKQEKIRQEKKAAKEKRREEALRKKESQIPVVNAVKDKANDIQHSNNKNLKATKDKKNTKPAKAIKSKKRSAFWCWLLPFVFVTFFAFLVWRYLGANFPNNLTNEVLHDAVQRLKNDSYELYHLSSEIGANFAQYLFTVFYKTVEDVKVYLKQTS